MNLVKVGNSWLNFDLVAMVKDLSREGPTNEQKLVRVHFLDGQRMDLVNCADALVAWMEENSAIPQNPEITTT